MLLSDAKALFLNYLLGRKNRSLNTISTYDKILRQFIMFVGNKPIDELTLIDIDNYADDLLARGCVVKTRRNKLATVRSFVRFLYIKDLSTIKPEQVELPVIKKIEANFLTTEEAQKLVSVIGSTRDRALVLTMLATWARISEVLDMQIGDLYKRSIVIRAGKGGEPRPVFINEETEVAINAYIKEIRGDLPGPIFRNYRGETLGTRYVNRLLKKYAGQAGITKKVSCHTLRHTGATGYIENGGTLESANQILGHKSIYTTMIYLHFLDARLHADYDSVTPASKYNIRETLTEMKM